MKVFITQKLPAIAYKLLVNAGFEVTVYDDDKTILKRDLIKLAKDADGIISLLTDKIDSNVISKLPNCKVIANYAVGFNNIDVDYASKKGIVVTNTPDILTQATADLTFALILSVARRVVEGDHMLRDGLFRGWKPELLLGMELSGKTIGIFGAGRIGQAVGLRAKAFGMNILYTSKSRKHKFEKKTGSKKVGLKTLLKESDVVTLHAPLTPKTNGLIDKSHLDLLKSNSIFINTARGEIADENHLISKLKNKQLFGAGFDVYVNEPKVNKKLLKLQNTVLLPHLGSGTIETRNEMAKLAAENVIKVLMGKKPLTPVN
jgi:glyoxylate reductase